ncbi:hypothetical protein P8452_75227 [Trifolium repens]|nr:hypothetical protein P8452_75227 [Trifolium repens]
MARRKLGHDRGTGMDRLSALPDAVLCHILSFLPTITSVADMSLVSHRFRHLWKYLQVFHFDDFDSGFICIKKFALFVNAVLALRRSRDIRKFNLHLEDKLEDDHSVEMWVLAATGPHLEEMSLTIASDDTIALPPSFLMNCTNLVSLSLIGDIYTDYQHFSIHFPSLKKLDLHTFLSRDRFLSGCPALETLDTYFVDGNSMKKVFAIPSSNSMSLKSTNENFTWTYLQINGQSLGIVSYLQSMVEAFLHVFPPCESEFIDPILKDLRDYFHEITLCSRYSTSKCSLHAPVLNYPEFHNLHHLKFILPCFNSNLLLNVLEKCHVLQVLIIQSNKEEPSPSRTWEPHSITLPKCLKSHLTYIHIEAYQGFEDELIFAEYILRNGLVLETMLVFADISMDITNKYHSLKRLTNISKGSVKCQLKFDPDGSH